MKKKIIITVIGLIFIVGLFVVYSIFKKEEDTTLTKIRLAEVTHSAFYAPMYVAIEEGYMAEEGIEIELLLTPGADKVAAAVLSGDVEVGFAGEESAIYIYAGEEEDYLVTFAGLTKRDGQFIISRDEDFSWEDLEGKEATTVELADIQENIENMDKIYVQKESVVQENYDKFMEYVDMYPDGNTQIEKETAGYILESFDENQELIQENQKTIEDLINKAEEGTVNIHEIKEEKDGDIKITGEQIVEMVKKEKVSGIKAAFQNMQNFFKGLFKENTNDQR